jgi:predicted ATPase/class 3 adenylate cyclase
MPARARLVVPMVAELPVGTISFLFTDIEQSSELARRSGSDFVRLIKTHFEIIDAAVRRASGTVVKNTGDGVFAVYERVSDALASACDIQNAISGHDWPLGLDVRVRVGIHTGEATLEADDYVGIEVHRAARVMSAGHGGQVLVSEATRTLAGDRYQFRDLGRHLLRGMEKDEIIYQLVAPGLAQEFPPLTTAALIPNNLPTRVTSLLGREADLDALSAMVANDRLVTLLGPGGVGKTSLALSVASRSIASFPGGVTFVDLSAVRDPALVISSIAGEVRAEPRTLERTIERLNGQRCLLLLDNLEQAIGAAPDIGQLVTHTDDAHFLVTSQVPLRLSVEKRYLLGSLPTDEVDGSPGVELFMERARSVAPDFEASPESVVELVRELDGLPLAIELVAARANLLTVEQMLDRLRTGRPSYGAPSDAPERQRSLEAALEWSYGLLGPTTRSVFRQLSLFAGGFTLEAAENVAIGPNFDPVDEIGELVDRSLITRQVNPAGRFRMLDGIRHFARLHLEDSDEFEPTLNRFIGFYVDLGADAHDGLLSDRSHWWLSQLDAEIDNVRAVLTTLMSRGRADEALGLLGNIWRFHLSRGHLLELQTWLDQLLAMSESASHIGRVKGVMAQGAVYYWQQREDEAVETYSQAVEQARPIGDDSLVADALFGMATSLVMAGRREEAGPFLEESRALYTQLEDLSGVADVVAGEAFIAAHGGALEGLGPQLREATRLYESVGRRVQATQTIYAEAAAAITEGRISEARELVLRGIRNGVDLADVFLQAWGIDYLARVEYELGNFERAGLFAGAVEVARERMGGGWGPETVGLDTAGTLLRKTLPESEAAGFIAAGRQLQIDEAVDLAAADAADSPTTSRSPT